MKVLIIEDEPFARAELIRLLKATGTEFEVVAEIDTVEESIEWFRGHPHPDLVFLDIQLADGISFEIFRQVKVKTPIIFTTAYDEYAIRAFELNSIDYLLKPIKQDMLGRALEKLNELHANKKYQAGTISIEQIEKMMADLGKAYKTRILVRLGDQLRSVEMEEVAFFYSEDDVVFAHLKDRGRYIVDHTLNSLEGLVDPGRFFRITRNCIASFTAIKKVSKYFNSRLMVELEPPAPDRLLVSRVRVPEFLKWMDK